MTAKTRANFRFA